MAHILKSLFRIINTNKMKRILYLSLIMPVFFFSCESNPDAHFYTDTVEPDVGHEVIFTNDSHNAKSFKWDFGDGYISNDKNPRHIYTGTSTYEVVLTAISKNGLEDKASLILDVMIPTLLEIEVREYYEEYTVAGAKVILYPSITDWDAMENIVSEGITDADGIVVFAGLEPFGYYVDVSEKNHDNYALRDYDYMTYIRTPDVLAHKINRFVAWVDYFENPKGSGKGERRVIIRNLERKLIDRRQPVTNSDTDGWQELFNRRAVKK
jgi:PKD repeat protein